MQQAIYVPFKALGQKKGAALTDNPSFANYVASNFLV